jgi:hypothetical protein
MAPSVATEEEKKTGNAFASSAPSLLDSVISSSDVDERIVKAMGYCIKSKNTLRVSWTVF